MADRFRICRALHRALTGYLPLLDGLRLQIRFRVVMGEELGLRLGDLRKALFQDLRNLAVIILAPAAQQRLIGRVLEQRVFEAVVRLRRDALDKQQLRVGQLSERRLQLLVIQSRHRAE